MTTLASPADSTGPGEARGRPVDTKAAAASLGMPEYMLRRFDDAKIITPARIDSHGARWWNLHDLRRQLAAYLDEDGRR